MKTERVKLYGGPGHRKVVHWDLSSSRIVMNLPRPLPTPCLPQYEGEPCPFDMLPNYERTSYYLRRWEAIGRTQWGRARVRRSLVVGIWENDKLHPHEEYEINDDLHAVPWEWDKEPSFLKNFEAWYEKVLHDLGWQQIRVCY